MNREQHSQMTDLMMGTNGYAVELPIPQPPEAGASKELTEKYIAEREAYETNLLSRPAGKLTAAEQKELTRIILRVGRENPGSVG